MAFHQFDREEFESFLNENVEYVVVEHDDYWEYAYDIPLPSDYFSIRVFSTISKHTEYAREKGADSIKVVVWSLDEEQPVGGREYTKRIPTYQKNLLQKIQYLLKNWKETVHVCPECHHLMVLRDGENGSFLGCSQYPECTHTESLGS